MCVPSHLGWEIANNGGIQAAHLWHTTLLSLKQLNLPHIDEEELNTAVQDLSAIIETNDTEKVKSLIKDICCKFNDHHKPTDWLTDDFRLTILDDLFERTYD